VNPQTSGRRGGRGDPLGGRRRGDAVTDLLGRLLRQVGQLQRQVLTSRGTTFSGLTERETAVLRLLAQGHDITSRLEPHNRTHAVAYAIREGLI
jgi:DNA-binding NarL/FixJ family response regulator